MDGRCATCRWWSDADADRRRFLFGDRFPPERRADWNECTLQGEAAARFGIAGFEESFLLTAPDFGCVQWEAAE